MTPGQEATVALQLIVEHLGSSTSVLTGSLTTNKFRLSCQPWLAPGFTAFIHWNFIKDTLTSYYTCRPEFDKCFATFWVKAPILGASLHRISDQGGGIPVRHASKDWQNRHTKVSPLLGCSMRRLSDERGGIPASGVSKVWHYGYTKVSPCGQCLAL